MGHCKLWSSCWLNNLSRCLNLLFMFMMMLLMMVLLLLLLLLILLSWLIFLVMLSNINLFNLLNNFNNLFNNLFNLLSFSNCGFSRTNSNFLTLYFSLVDNLALLLIFTWFTFFLLTFWLLWFTNWSSSNNNLTFNFSAFNLRCWLFFNNLLLSFSSNSLFFS